MPTRIAIALALVACSQGERESPSAREPIVGALDSIGAALSREPAGPPGPSRELRDGLGLDGKDVPAVPANTAARFAVLVDSDDTGLAEEIRVYRIAGGKVALESTVALAPDDLVTSWAWRDSRELVLLIRKDTIDDDPPKSLHRLVGGKLESVAWPEKKLFKASKPSHRDDHLFATPANEVWLDQCRRYAEREPHPCLDHVSVRVAPPAARAAVRPTERPAVADLSPLRDWSLTVKPRAGRKTGVLECRGPHGTAATVTPSDTHSFGYRPNARWLSHHPPIQYVEEEIGGEGDEANVLVSVDRHFLRACKLTDGYMYSVEVYAPGFWSVHDGDAENTRRGATIVLWHGRVLATIPGAEKITFAP